MEGSSGERTSWQAQHTGPDDTLHQVEDLIGDGRRPLRGHRFAAAPAARQFQRGRRPRCRSMATASAGGRERNPCEAITIAGGRSERRGGDEGIGLDECAHRNGRED